MNNSIRSFSRQEEPTFSHNDGQSDLDHSLSATSHIFEPVQMDPQLRPADELAPQPMVGYVEPAKMHSGHWNIPGPTMGPMSPMNPMNQDMYPNTGDYSPQYDQNPTAVMPNETYS